MVSLLERNERLFFLRDSSRPGPLDFSALAGPQVTIVDVGPDPFSLSQQWTLPRLLRSLRPDMYHSPYIMMPYWPSVPTIVTVHDLIPLVLPGESSGKARAFFRWALRLALRASSRVLAVSESTRQDLLKHTRYRADRITVTLLGADSRFQPVPPAEIDVLKARLGLNEKYALYLGTFKPHKNLARLLGAWSRLDSGYMSLVVAGLEPKERQAAQRWNRGGPGIFFLGRVEEADLPALYSGADLFIFPSLHEGFGLPVLEAMACGTPVVCADSSSLVEVAGKAAVYFNPADEDDMVRTLSLLVNDRERLDKMREESLAGAAAFSWEQTATRTLHEYRRLYRDSSPDIRAGQASP